MRISTADQGLRSALSTDALPNNCDDLLELLEFTNGLFSLIEILQTVVPRQMSLCSSLFSNCPAPRPGDKSL